MKKSNYKRWLARCESMGLEGRNYFDYLGCVVRHYVRKFLLKPALG